MKLSERRIKLRNKIVKISPKAQMLAFIFILLICFIYGCIITNNKKDINIIQNTSTNSPFHENSIDKATPLVSNETLLIHVSGAVEKPGLVSISVGSRINDAINAAGGLKKDADLTNINLAELVYDGYKIHIPVIGEIVSTPHSSENNNSSQSKKININTASLSELTTLKGIGEATAMKIIEYRNKNGLFNSIKDLLNVSGIGESKYKNIKDYICVQ